MYKTARETSQHSSQLSSTFSTLNPRETQQVAGQWHTTFQKNLHRLLLGAGPYGDDIIISSASAAYLSIRVSSIYLFVSLSICSSVYLSACLPRRLQHLDFMEQFFLKIFFFVFRITPEPILHFRTQFLDILGFHFGNEFLDILGIHFGNISRVNMGSTGSGIHKIIL